MKVALYICLIASLVVLIAVISMSAYQLALVGDIGKCIGIVVVGVLCLALGIFVGKEMAN
jgi:hypothetical protein